VARHTNMPTQRSSMKSTCKIIWTDHALSELNDIINHLESNWTRKEISRLFKKIEKSLAQIGRNPAMYPKTDKRESVRRAVLTRQLTLYYKTDKNIIYILSLFDNRRNPKARKS